MAPNIALVGCGAIAKQFYLPALAMRRRDFNRVWVIDPSAKARHAASLIVDARQCNALADVTDELQFVIVASPNGYHFATARQALLRNAHVLIEKPFVIWPREGRELVDLAAQRGCLIAVNQTRRIFPYAQEIRKRMGTGEFGTLKAISHNEGAKLTWPFSSGTSFARDAQRTGVIMDIGVHVIDFYQYLLNPNWAFVSTIHDGFNGPEGLAEIHLKADEAPVSIRLSRYQRQENVAHLDFENAKVRINFSEPGAYYVTGKSNNGPRRFIVESAIVDFELLSRIVLANFVAAGDGLERPICDAVSSLPVIEILDEIYRRAERYSDTPGLV